MIQEYEIPIIEMRIRGLGREIVSAFMSHSDELRPFVEHAVNKYLASESIQRVIDNEVEDTIKLAIKESISSYQVKNKIRMLIDNQILGTQVEE